jgi:hypothetical protein
LFMLPCDGAVNPVKLPVVSSVVFLCCSVKMH